MRTFLAIGVLTTLALAACAPAAQPSPTTAPAKAVPPSAPTKQEAKPAATTAAAKPAATKPQAAEKPAAKADTKAAEEFFKGKTIRIIVGFAPGGGFDSYSRLIARHLPKHLPGNPTIIVENMDGAGSRLAANNLYNVAPKDGTVIANFHGNLFMQQALGGTGLEFEGEKFEFVGVPTRDHNLCVASGQSGFKSLKEAQNPGGRVMIVGADAPGSTTYDVPAVLTEALDLNTKIVQGYSGTSKTRIAMEQGEVDALCGWSWESVKTSSYDDVVGGTIVPTVQVTDKPISDLPVKDVPLARDLAKTDEARQLIRFGIENVSSFNRPYLLPPGTPKVRVELIQKAFADTLSDPALLEDAKKAKLDIGPVSGAELEQLVKETLSMPEAMTAKLKKILAPAS